MPLTCNLLQISRKDRVRQLPQRRTYCIREARLSYADTSLDEWRTGMAAFNRESSLRMERNAKRRRQGRDTTISAMIAHLRES